MSESRATSKSRDEEVAEIKFWLTGGGPAGARLKVAPGIRYIDWSGAVWGVEPNGHMEDWSGARWLAVRAVDVEGVEPGSHISLAATDILGDFC